MTNTTQITDDLYERYVEIEQELEHLEELKTALKAQIISDLNTKGIQQLKNDKATFSIAATMKYKYSDTVNTSEEYLKGLKQTERENGTAEKTETPTLRVQLL